MIEGVLTPAECEQYQEGVWRWLEGLGVGLDRHDPATWHSEAWPPSFKGIINTLEVAHQDFVWRVRKHPGCPAGRRGPPVGTTESAQSSLVQRKLLLVWLVWVIQLAI